MRIGKATKYYAMWVCYVQLASSRRLPKYNDDHETRCSSLQL